MRDHYHHGNLRRALLDCAAEAITDNGIAALSMRQIARRAGVSHTAAARYFPSLGRLLTELAADGFDKLAKMLTTSWLASNHPVELAVTYVRFAYQHAAHFDLMFRTDVYDTDAAAVRAASDRAAVILRAALPDLPDTFSWTDPSWIAAVADGPGPPESAKWGIAALAAAHGLASLRPHGADRHHEAETATRLVLAGLAPPVRART